MINNERAESLKAYLQNTQDLLAKKVHKLVIDECGVTDQSFSSILEGIYS